MNSATATATAAATVSADSSNGRVNGRNGRYTQSIVIPVHDSGDVRVCSECEDSGKSKARRNCPCRTRTYVPKETVIQLLLQERARDHQPVFGPDMQSQMGTADGLQGFRIKNEQDARLFFHMFDDVYPNRENGLVNLYREHEPLDEGEIESLLLDFRDNKLQYLREIFDVAVDPHDYFFQDYEDYDRDDHDDDDDESV